MDIEKVIEETHGEISFIYCSDKTRKDCTPMCTGWLLMVELNEMKERFIKEKPEDSIRVMWN